MVPRKAFCLSLSGSGHLLVYQLGACAILLENSVPLQSATGSSGGAVVAALLAKVPHSIESYAQDFIRIGGRAMDLLKDVIQDNDMKQQDYVIQEFGICTTICSTGKAHRFSFRSKETEQNEFLLQCIGASCKIPRSFHPWDIFSKAASTYPDDDGVLIRGEYHVDGGIAAAAPPTDSPRLIIAPISGIMDAKAAGDWRISPVDASFSLGQLHAPIHFPVRMSIQNLKSLTVSMGMANTEVLRDWYLRGQADATDFLSHL